MAHDVRTMTAEELAKAAIRVGERWEAIDELERRAATLDRLEAATTDRWYFRLERTADGTWVAQKGAAAEVERPTARAAVEAALQEPQP